MGDSAIPVVVVGGYEYSPAMNQPATVTVRELERDRDVLYLHSEAHGSLLRRLDGRARNLSAAGVVRTAMGPMRVRRLSERLWLAPVRGLAAIAPLSTPEVARRRNVRLFASLIRQWLADIGATRCILVMYWWALPELVDEVPNVASVYDCTDDHTSLPGALLRVDDVAELEGRTLDAVDRSYLVSKGLLAARAGPGRKISVLPNAFDLSLFERLERDGFTVPDAFDAIPGPIVGYAGGIGDRMSWELVHELARRRPRWSWVFVGGGARSAPRAVREQPNTYFVDSVPYPVALGAISRFDAATIPVRRSDFSRGNSFLKLLDYLAHGKPTVATPLPDTIAAAEAAPGLLRLAEDADEWEQALQASLDEPASSPVRAARRRYVEARSGRCRVERMLADALGEGA